MRELVDHVERRAEIWRSEVIDQCFDRFDATLQKRLVEMEGRVAGRLAETEARLADRISATRVEFLDRLADLRVEVLRWTFGFWVGQAVVITGAIAALLQFVDR